VANQIKFKDQLFNIGDTISIHYQLKEGDKTRTQIFKGILIRIKGQTPETKTITVRKLSKSGIGVERIIPISSPFLQDIKLIKKSIYKKARAYFIRSKTESEIKKRLYGQKK
jgi:large subunit ribosomal protein L19